MTDSSLLAPLVFEEENGPPHLCYTCDVSYDFLK